MTWTTLVIAAIGIFGAVLLGVVVVGVGVGELLLKYIEWRANRD